MSPRRRITSRSMRTSGARGNELLQRRLDALRALADRRELVAATRAGERQRLARRRSDGSAAARARRCTVRRASQDLQGAIQPQPGQNSVGA